MTRLTRPNLMPMLLVLLGLLPAALGMAPGLVRCEHAGDRTHVADALHHTDAGSHDCGEHGDSEHPADPQSPSDEVPCEDTPLQIDLAPVQTHSVVLDLPDAPLLPVLAWVPAEQAIADRSLVATDLAADPPAGHAGLCVVDTTILRL